MEMTTIAGITAARQAGGGRYDGPDSYAVRVRHVAGHPSGCATTEHWGDWPEHVAERVAEVLAMEYGGRVGRDAHAITVVSGRPTGGRPPVGPLVSARFPRELLARLDAHRRGTGQTRSELIRDGALAVLATGAVPGQEPAGLAPFSVRLPEELIRQLDARKRELGTTRSALLRHGAEAILAGGDR